MDWMNWAFWLFWANVLFLLLNAIVYTLTWRLAKRNNLREAERKRIRALADRVKMEMDHGHE